MELKSDLKVGLWSRGCLPLMDVLTDSLKSVDPEVGAISIFLGIVKRLNRSRSVKNLELEAYEEVALKIFREIASSIKREYSVNDVRIHHAVGDLNPGEPVMLILVSGSSRHKVVDALKEAVERVKRDSPLWKKEVLLSGESYWVEYR
ncbi:MAG: molybdenum cofactor biosynthesis protein MoaE [Candidatus Bathyarchaeia archaeon]|nr:molybdenum cofactor biosynthesis protein MoaE [Candidatus Bathyarchaeota archaeon]